MRSFAIFRDAANFLLLLAVLAWSLVPTDAQSFTPSSETREASIQRALQSVVSVLPTWPGYPKGAAPKRQGGPTNAPEGSGIVYDTDGHILTAYHVIAQASAVDVRMADGRILPAQIIGIDPPTDIAVLKLAPIGTSSLAIEPAQMRAEVAPGRDVCAIGNAFGLDLTVSCGVISAAHRSNAGFNPIEDFHQTDAAMNPGSSGGALIDETGHVVGMLSAIITKDSDANIGINFAVSTALLKRVADDLIAFGKVRPGISGLVLAPLSPKEAATGAGMRVRQWRQIGVAPSASGDDGTDIQVGDIIRSIDGRRLRSQTDARTAIYLRREGESITVILDRPNSAGAPNAYTRIKTNLVVGGIPR